MKIEKISIKHVEELKKLIKDYDNNEEDYNGAFFLKNIDDFGKKIKELDDAANGILENPAYVPYTCYVFLENNEIVGVGSLRHYLNDYLKEYGGHIGYSVKPSERKKGYGTNILKLLKKEATNFNNEGILVTCDSTNIGSQKVIINNGGVFIGEIINGDKITYKYLIN